MLKITRKDSLRASQISVEKDFFRTSKDQTFFAHKKSVVSPHPKIMSPFNSLKSQNHDFLLETLLQKSSNAFIEDLNLILSKIESEQIKISKTLFRKIVKNLEIIKPAISNFPVLKKVPLFPERTIVLTTAFLEEQKQIAIKNLVSENFDDILSGNKQSFLKNQKLTKKIQNLFQKEMLFEHSFSLLLDDEIDVNQLLFCAFEKIQSENYVPSPNCSKFVDGHFEYEDTVRMEPSKLWKDKNRASQFKIQINDVPEND